MAESVQTQTILLLSLVYVVGTLTLSITAIEALNHWSGAVIGLFFVAMGTGGIKPNVSAFVGDQLHGSPELQERVFALLYLFINMGSLSSTIVTPMIRHHLGFAEAFSVPAFLLVIATAVFWLGRKSYRRVPPGENLLGIVWKCCSHSFWKWKAAPKAERKAHWMDHGRSEYGSQLVRDIKRFLRIVGVFVPIPIFWAIFDQHSSRWVFQAMQMNRKLGSLLITEDQMPLFNPLFVLILIPLFDRVIYPLLRACSCGMRPIHRMFWGMCLAAASFALAGALQLAIDAEGVGKVHVALQIPQVGATKAENMEDLPVQYLVLTSGEIMVSVTGLEFAFSQAPPSMKSVIMSMWYVSVALGNILVAVVAEADLMKQAVEFFFFCGLMVLFALGFLWMTRGYVYVEDAAALSESEEEDEILQVAQGQHEENPPDESKRLL